MTINYPQKTNYLTDQVKLIYLVQRRTLSLDLYVKHYITSILLGVMLNEMTQKKSSLLQTKKIKDTPSNRLISCRNLNEIIASLFFTKVSMLFF